MIGGLKLPRAGGTGVNANELELFPISLLLSPLTTAFLSKSVGAQQYCVAEAAPTAAAATRARLSISRVIGCSSGQKGLPITEN